MADRMENPVGQYHRLQSGDPASRMNATSPARPSSQARPRRHVESWCRPADQSCPHHSQPRPIIQKSAPQRREITDPRIQAKFRHHVGQDETAIDMVGRAAAGLIERHGHDVIAGIDVLITHTQMPDIPFYGAGGGIAHRLGMRPSWVLDLHNGGCAAFMLGLNVARQLLASGQGCTALIAIAQNAAGQVFDQPGVRRKAQSRYPATAPRSDWSRCPTDHPSSKSNAAPTANTPVT
jgi:3-Oxoacyl-[acyl-carrier-protein (ACP)] synthase III